MSSTSSNIRTAIAAIAVGSASGGALISAALAVAYGMPRGPQSAFANVAITSAGAGLIGAAVVAFVLAKSLGTWRSLLAGIIAVSGASLVAVMTTIADGTAGRAGLIALTVLCGVVIVAASRYRAAADATA